MSFFIFCGVRSNRRRRSAVSPSQTEQVLNTPAAHGLCKRPPRPPRCPVSTAPQRRTGGSELGRYEALRGKPAGGQPTSGSTPQRFCGSSGCRACSVKMHVLHISFSKGKRIHLIQYPQFLFLKKKGYNEKRLKKKKKVKKKNKDKAGAQIHIFIKQKANANQSFTVPAGYSPLLTPYLHYHFDPTQSILKNFRY